MENSKIEWTDHTFNPWIGCTKVSAGCQHCYAEELMDKRYGKVKWGPQGTRQRTSAANWRKPLQWNKLAWETCKECGWRGPVHETHDFCPNCDGEELLPARARVFCASLADVFERRDELIPWRADLMTLIGATPNLDWLLLTKRPENILDMTPWPWHMSRVGDSNDLAPGGGIWPANVWIGTSVENQEAADKRIPELLKVPAKVRFLSCEPLLGPVDLGFPFVSDNPWMTLEHVDWVIAGAESGHGARPMQLDWVRSIRDQCQKSYTAFFFKQMLANGKKVGLPELDGHQWAQMPEVAA